MIVIHSQFAGWFVGSYWKMFVDSVWAIGGKSHHRNAVKMRGRANSV